MTSFKTPREYYRMPPKFLPNQFVLFHYKEAFAPWTIDPTELSEATYYIEESAGRVESVVPNILTASSSSGVGGARPAGRGYGPPTPCRVSSSGEARTWAAGSCPPG